MSLFGPKKGNFPPNFWRLRRRKSAVVVNFFANFVGLGLCHGTHSCHENIKVGSCPGKTPSRGLLPDTPNFPIIPCPSGQGGYKYCLLHIHRLGTTPIGGFAPDLPSYGCAGPHLTKIQFRSRCVRAGTISKTPREE